MGLSWGDSQSKIPDGLRIASLRWTARPESMLTVQTSKGGAREGLEMRVSPAAGNLAAIVREGGIS